MADVIHKSPLEPGEKRRYKLHVQARNGDAETPSVSSCVCKDTDGNAVSLTGSSSVSTTYITLPQFTAPDAGDGKTYQIKAVYAIGDNTYTTILIVPVKTQGAVA